jgi:hypothetical protein
VILCSRGKLMDEDAALWSSSQVKSCGIVSTLDADESSSSGW